jgi:hypothetical protein
MQFVPHSSCLKFGVHYNLSPVTSQRFRPVCPSNSSDQPEGNPGKAEIWVMSGMQVTRVEPRHRLLPLFELSPSRLGECSVLKRLHRYFLSCIY